MLDCDHQIDCISIALAGQNLPFKDVLARFLLPRLKREREWFVSPCVRVKHFPRQGFAPQPGATHNLLRALLLLPCCCVSCSILIFLTKTCPPSAVRCSILPSSARSACLRGVLFFVVAPASQRYCLQAAISSPRLEKCVCVCVWVLHFCAAKLCSCCLGVKFRKAEQSERKTERA